MTVLTSELDADFHQRIGEIVDDLDKHSVQYRAIGSVAADALGIAPLSIQTRDELYTVDQLPDIDLIVPRDELPVAREIRKKHATATLPIKIGLAIPSLQIDMKPDESQSALTLGKTRLTLPSSVFDAQHRQFNGVPIRTVSRETLRHIYGPLSPKRGPNGPKYQAKFDRINDVLGQDVHGVEEGLDAFHMYEDLANIVRPVSQRSIDLFDKLTERMNPEHRARLKKLALNLADVAGWR